MTTQKINGIILDFDGTIAKNSVDVAFHFIYDYLRQFKPIPHVFVYNYFKNITAFQMGEAVRQLFSAVGLEEKTMDCLKKFTEITGYQTTQIEIEEDFFDFVHFCQKNSLRIKIFSSAGSKQLRFKPLFTVLKKDDFLSYSDCPKSNPATFTSIANDLKLDVSNLIYVDDTPLALWGAKVAGFTTVMMINRIFTDKDYEDYREFIDKKINSFNELEDFCKQRV
jgi:FMN phosphatase YigB (HAD superfamily)